MTEQRESQGQNTGERSLRKILLPFTLGIGLPLFSGAAYLTGISYHQAYLRAFRVPLNLIGKTTSDYFLYAYIAVTEAGLGLLGASGLIAIAAAIFGVYFWQSLRWMDQKLMQRNEREWIRNQVRTRPSLRFFGSLISTPVVVIGLSYALFGLFILFLVPMMFGQIAGERRAIKDSAAYSRGCENAKPSFQYCNEIFEDGSPVPVASGFIIDGSEKYVAIYEKDAIRTIPLEGRYFVARHRVREPSTLIK